MILPKVSKGLFYNYPQNSLFTKIEIVPEMGIIIICGVPKHYAQRLRLGDVAVFENRQPVTAAKFINKRSLFILLLGVIRRLELKPNS
jgi:hypothetical protein